MAEAEAEQVDLARMPSGLLINSRTMDALDGMLAAGSYANQNGKPVVFDPVGIGATSFRRATAASEHFFVRVLSGKAFQCGVPRATRCMAADGDQGKCSGNWHTRRHKRGPPTVGLARIVSEILFLFSGSRPKVDSQWPHK
jgi:hypothetical protein